MVYDSNQLYVRHSPRFDNTKTATNYLNKEVIRHFKMVNRAEDLYVSSKVYQKKMYGIVL